jgi:uncharacterized protein
MPEEWALIDANVLVYATYPECEFYVRARALLDRAQSGEVALCVTSQVLAEFYAVVTDARRVTKPRQPLEVLKTIEDVMHMPGMSLLPTPIDVVDRWIVLARKYPVTRGAIFDVQLAATMLANGVVKIYTFNRGHFERYHELEVLTP